ncbi:unnamed protein product, partial [Durusdinium trenchii]
MDINSSAGLALAILLVLQSSPGALHLMAPVCGSWTRISRGTSWRSCMNCFGDLSKEWITGANQMISRCVVIMLLSIALHCNFLCEQPMGSSDVFPNHPRLSWLCNKVAVVWRNNFWMLHHGAKCPKRTTVWSVQRCLVLGLDKGKLKKAVKEKKATVKTTRKYVKKDGTMGFCGSSSLKGT